MEMIVFFFIIGFFLGLTIIVRTANGRDAEYKKKVIEKCKKHDWSYNKDNKLECCECGSVASNITFKDSEEY